MADQRATSSCRQCDSRMELVNVKKFAGRWPMALIIAGVFCCLFFIGALVGIPLLIGGIYMATAKVNINRCPECGYYYNVWEKGRVSG